MTNKRVVVVSLVLSRRAAAARSTIVLLLSSKVSRLVRVRTKATTEITTKSHYNDVVCEMQIGEGSFGIVFRGMFKRTDVVIKKTMGVDESNGRWSSNRVGWFLLFDRTHSSPT